MSFELVFTDTEASAVREAATSAGSAAGLAPWKVFGWKLVGRRRQTQRGATLERVEGGRIGFRGRAQRQQGITTKVKHCCCMEARMEFIAADGTP